MVTLPASLAGKVNTLIAARPAAYRSFNEFVRVALANQLALELVGNGATLPGTRSSDKAGAVDLLDRGGDADELLLLKRPEGEAPALAPLRDDEPADEALFVLTNRLAPVKVAIRVLACMATVAKEWPPMKAFQQRAGRAARALGERLDRDDESRGARGFARTATAFPIGRDAEKTIARFITSFTIKGDADGARGALRILGLAGLHDGRAVLTEPGWRLAVAESPLLGECAGRTMSDEERMILTDRIVCARGEARAVHQFLSAVDMADGVQEQIDHHLQAWNAGWSRSRAVAQRAAMIGRLNDMDAVMIEGRGPEGRVRLTGRGLKFASLIARRVQP